MKSIYLILLLGFSLVAQAAEVVREDQGRSLVANLELAPGQHLRDGVVLMTHGTLAHGQMEIMATLQQLLKENGINSLSINLSLGLDDRHGMYDCAIPHTHRHEDAVQEIGGWLAWLKQKGAGEVVLLGHSRGGNQTAWYASEHSAADYSKVVLIAPATWSEQKESKAYQQRYHKPLAGVLQKAERMVARGEGASMMEHTDFIYCPDTSVSASSFVSYYRVEPRRHTPGLLGRINKPVLVIAGSEDKVVEGLVEAVKPMAVHKEVKLRVIDGADHFFRDLYAEEAVEAIIEFMEQ